MKKRTKIIILVVIILIVLLALISYFLFFNKTTMSYFGFNSPDFSKTASVGDVVGAGTDANAWDDTKLNPFRNES